MLSSPLLSRRAFLSGFCACCALTALPSCVATSRGAGSAGMLSPADEAKLGGQAWAEIKKKMQPTKNGELRQITGNVLTRILNAAKNDAGGMDWEYEVFEAAEPNAFALPGGKVGVHTGLFNVAKNESQLATVLGHEVRHVTGHHPAQRYEQQMLTNAGLQVAAMALGRGSNVGDTKLLMSVLGAGAQVGLTLPFSREQETEADLIGLEYMAAAGFDPRESIPFWQNMMAAGAGRGPTFLSSHPAGQERIAALQGKIQDILGRQKRA